MNFETPEGYFRLRLQKRYGTKWHAVGWPTVGEVRLALLANLDLVKPFLAEIGQLSRDREQSPAVCAPARVGDDSGDFDPVPSPAGEARQGDLQTEGPAGEVDALTVATGEAKATTASAGPGGAVLAAALQRIANHDFSQTAAPIGTEGERLLVTESGYVLDEPRDTQDAFTKELELLINRHSKESGSDTPDFLLAEYLQNCLEVYNKTVRAREEWHGRGPGLRFVNVDDPGVASIG